MSAPEDWKLVGLPLQPTSYDKFGGQKAPRLAYFRGLPTISIHHIGREEWEVIHHNIADRSKSVVVVIFATEQEALAYIETTIMAMRLTWT